MGRHIAALQTGIENITIFLGIGALSEPCILKEGTLGDQDIFVDTRLGFDNRIPVERRTRWNRNRRRDVDNIKNPLESVFAIFHKIHDEPLRKSPLDKIDIMVQFVQGIAVQKIKLAGIADPHSPGADIKVSDLTALDV